MEMLEKYLGDAVFYNQKYQQEIMGDEKTTGDACWDLHDTLLYLFSNEKETEENTLYSYELEAKPQVHFVVKLGEKVYEMLDGIVYIKDYINDETLVRNSLILLKENDRRIKTATIISKKCYELSSDKQIKEKFKTLA